MSDEPVVEPDKLVSRRINIIWELTQALIAVMVAVSKIYCSIYMIESVSMDNAFFLIIGFYFGRTNNQRSLVGTRNGNA